MALTDVGRPTSEVISVDITSVSNPHKKGGAEGRLLSFAGLDFPLGSELIYPVAAAAASIC